MLTPIALTRPHWPKCKKGPMPKKQHKTIHFVSLGCPKNRVDTEVMAGVSTEKGLEIVPDPETADIIVVNTCAFIESAKKESVDVLLEMAAYKRADDSKIIVSAGCLSQRYGNELAVEMPELTHIIGTEFTGKIEQIIEGTANRVYGGPAAHFLQKRETPRFHEPGTPSAYIKIADGCTRKCSFCAIPSIRGKATSRPVEDIVSEARHLGESGVKELVVVAQDTSAYGRDLDNRTDLGVLLNALGEVAGIQWIRLLYLYPTAITTKLLKTIASVDKVVPYLDIPVQHASANMLKRMGRGHEPGQLRTLIERINKIIPDAFLRTSVLVGHPGETERDFRELVEFVKFAQFDHLGGFRYSDEEGTHSYNQQNKTTKKNSYNRYRKIMSVQGKISKEKNKKRINSNLEVLVEGLADDQGYVRVGRHLGQAPEIDGNTYIVSSNAAIGDIVKTKVVKTDSHDLVVEPAG
jgi:ribosomal protein S12 methylthiotransferase